MLEDLKRRFNFMSDERDPDFDCSYLLATSLDCIETELLDYFHFASHEFDPSKDPPVQDVISYWKDLSGRFP